MPLFYPPNQSAQIFEHEGQFERIGGERFKAVVLIKALGCIVLCLNHDGTQTSDFRRLERAQQYEMGSTLET